MLSPHPKPTGDTPAALPGQAPTLLEIDVNEDWRQFGGLTPEQQTEIEQTVRFTADKRRHRS